MSRVLIVSYRPAPGQLEAVVVLLRAQYRRLRSLGVTQPSAPILARSAAGELTYVAVFDQANGVDRCWEDPEFQDLDAQIGQLAEMIPVRALHEASGSYMDLEHVTAEIRRSSVLDEAAGPTAELLS
jgi:hypothetical protein